MSWLVPPGSPLGIVIVVNALILCGGILLGAFAVAMLVTPRGDELAARTVTTVSVLALLLLLAMWGVVWAGSGTGRGA